MTAIKRIDRRIPIKFEDKMAFQQIRAECILNTFFLIILGGAVLTLSNEKSVGALCLLWGICTIRINIGLAKIFKAYEIGNP